MYQWANLSAHPHIMHACLRAMSARLAQARPMMTCIDLVIGASLSEPAALMDRHHTVYCSKCFYALLFHRHLSTFHGTHSTVNVAAKSGQAHLDNVA